MTWTTAERRSREDGGRRRYCRWKRRYVGIECSACVGWVQLSMSTTPAVADVYLCVLQLARTRQKAFPFLCCFKMSNLKVMDQLFGSVVACCFRHTRVLCAFVWLPKPVLGSQYVLVFFFLPSRHLKYTVTRLINGGRVCVVPSRRLVKDEETETI